MRIFLLLVSLGCTVSCAIRPWAEEHAQSFEQPQTAEHTQSFRYAVTLDDAPLGTITLVAHHSTDGKKAFWTYGTVRYARRSFDHVTDFDLSFDERSRYSATGAMEHAQSRHREGESQTDVRVVVKRKSERWQAHVTRQGPLDSSTQTLMSDVPVMDELGALSWSLASLRAGGGDTLVFASYSFLRGCLETKTLKVRAEPLPYGAGPESTPPVSYRATLSSDDGDSEYLVDDAGIPISIVVQGRITMKRVAKHATSHDALPPAPPAVLASTIAVEAVIPKWSRLKAMELELGAPAENPIHAHLSGASLYHTATRRAAEPHRLWLHLTSTAPDEKAAQALALPFIVPPEFVCYLEATPTCQSRNPLMLAQASDIVGTATGWEAVQRIVAWVHENLRQASGDRAQASALEALTQRQGDCTEFAALTVALCRAAGIPARSVYGLEYLVVGREAAFGYHAWAEVWLGRWIGVDATLKEAGTSARYICLGYDEPGDRRGSGLLLNTLGKIKIRVLGYTLKGETPVTLAAEAATDQASESEDQAKPTRDG